MPDIEMISRPRAPEVRRKTVRLQKRSPRPAENRDAKIIEQRVRRLGRRRLFSFNTLGWSLTDGVLAIVAVVLGYLASPVAGLTVTSETAVKLIPCAFSFALLLVPAAHIAGLHDPRRRSDVADLFVRCLLTVSIAMSMLALGWIMFSFLRIGRYVVFFATFFSILGMVATRLASWKWSSAFKQQICFVGTEKFCARVAEFIDQNPLPVSISERPDEDSNLAHWVSAREVDEVVYDSSSTTDDVGLLGCLDAGVKVSSYSDFIEEKYHRIPVDNIDAKWLFSARLDLAHPYYHGIKRIIDIAVSVVGLLVSAPLLLLAAIAIRLETAGSPFYSQIRAGRFNRPFRIYKLRTMVANSEENGAQWAAQNDSRMTATGKFLRRTRLDELPQFWNVLKGEMSLIGPRPERPEFVRELGNRIPFYLQRHLVKPGLTGWAQINYPYGASQQDAYNKLTYDFYYIKNASFGLDLQIFLRTIGTVMKGSR